MPRSTKSSRTMPIPAISSGSMAVFETFHAVIYGPKPLQHTFMLYLSGPMPQEGQPIRLTRVDGSRIEYHGVVEKVLKAEHSALVYLESETLLTN